MKLLRYGEPGREKPGMLDADGNLRDLSSILHDIDGNALSPEGLEKLAHTDAAKLPLVEGSPRIGPCVQGIGKLICVGLNYRDHATEAGMPIPEEPVLFMKSTTAISGPFDPIRLPPGSTRTDWEVELGIVVGSICRHVETQDAMRHVAGYCIVNDVSERSHQLERGGQWTKGKSADTFAPIGPWMVTADEIADPHTLDIWLELDGTRMQDSSTAQMIFGVAEVVSYISRFMTLLPGDIIPTGTPPGVGMGLKPPRYLRAGSRLRLGVTGLGMQEQVVVT